MTMHTIAVENRAYILNEYRRRLESFRRMRQENVDRQVLFNFTVLLDQSRRDAIYWSRYATFFSGDAR